MIVGTLALIILIGIVFIFLIKKTPTRTEGQLSANDFEIIELVERD